MKEHESNRAVASSISREADNAKWKQYLKCGRFEWGVMGATAQGSTPLVVQKGSRT